jgi:hypothetical protein
MYYDDYNDFTILWIYIRQTQWPRGLRHELSSLPQTLGSWVRISLKTWMSMCTFILCLCCPVCSR